MESVKVPTKEDFRRLQERRMEKTKNFLEKTKRRLVEEKKYQG